MPVGRARQDRLSARWNVQTGTSTSPTGRSTTSSTWRGTTTRPIAPAGAARRARRRTHRTSSMPGRPSSTGVRSASPSRVSWGSPGRSRTRSGWRSTRTRQERAPARGTCTSHTRTSTALRAARQHRLRRLPEPRRRLRHLHPTLDRRRSDSRLPRRLQRARRPLDGRRATSCMSRGQIIGTYRRATSTRRPALRPTTRATATRTPTPTGSSSRRSAQSGGVPEAPLPTGSTTSVARRCATRPTRCVRATIARPDASSNIAIPATAPIAAASQSKPSPPRTSIVGVWPVAARPRRSRDAGRSPGRPPGARDARPRSAAEPTDR